MKTIINILLALALAQGLAYAQPVVSSVLNAASYEAVVSPGCWVAIFGNNLAAGAFDANTSARLPTTLGGVSVTVGSLPAPMLYVSPTQINVLIPSEVAIPDNFVVPLVINAPGGSVSYNIRLTRTAPGIFTRNGAGTGRALIFDSNFQPVDTVAPKQVVIFYATGLGPTSGDSGSVADQVDVYIGERKAQVLFAGLAPGFPGIYQLNVIAPVPATDRLYLRLVHLRLQDWQSNIVDIGIKPGTNVSNVKGSIDALYPSSDPNFGLGLQASAMLHAGTLTASFDITPSAGPFDVAAVGDAGGAVISIDPAAGSYSGSITTLTAAAAGGDFSGSMVPLWDYVTCDPRSWECLAFPLSTITAPRLGPLWLAAAQMLPRPSFITSPGANAIAGAGGCLGGFRSDESCFGGSRFVIDGQSNANLSRFGGIVEVPLAHFPTRVSTFKLYVDGVQIASKNLTYVGPYRP